MGTGANATDSPAATVLRIANVPLSKLRRVNLRIPQMVRSIDTPPLNRLRVSLYLPRIEGGTESVRDLNNSQQKSVGAEPGRG
jgi:hypothetical protein